MLSNQDISRYNRQLMLPGFGKSGQEKLKNNRVLVVGAGGLGAPVLQYLAAAGVGKIGIIDHDVVDETNLQRQVIFDEKDIGKSKAEVAARYLTQRNSLISVQPFNQQLTPANVENLFSDFEIVVDCTDNFSSRYLINDACAVMEKVMVYGSIHRFQGQVSIFHLNGQDSPTYRCLFPEPPEPGTVQNCAEAGVLGVLPGLIGAIQANEAIKIITRLGDVLSGKLFMMDALTMESSLLEISRNPNTDSITPATMQEIRNSRYQFACDAPTNVPEITSADLMNRLKNGEKMEFVDVREPDEGPPPNELASRQIPLSELDAQFDDFNPQKTYILFCQVGRRSAWAVHQLKEKYQTGKFLNLKGGIEAWNQKNVE